LDEKDLKYSDFFGEEGPEDDEMDEDDVENESSGDEGEKEEAIQNEDVDDEELAERGILSSHQRRMKNLNTQIEQFEKEAISDRPWLLKGEVKGTARPENSLLEATLDYDRPTRVAPAITVEVTAALEDIIKQRVLDQNWDDVIRKFAVNETAQKEQVELSMEKSKEGLGEIYEKEFMKNAMGFEENEEMRKDQEEIEAMFKNLCWKLDALSNFHFTPKPIVRELQVKPSAPAITMEEVVPMSVSEANLRAPEEIYDKKRKRLDIRSIFNCDFRLMYIFRDGVVISTDEMTQDEKKARRNVRQIYMLLNCISTVIHEFCISSIG